MEWLLLLTVAGNPGPGPAGVNTISAQFETRHLCEAMAQAHAARLRATPAATGAVPVAFEPEQPMDPSYYVSGSRGQWTAPGTVEVTWSCSPTRSPG